MSAHPFFSLIVPVFNVENYLEACLNSILSQSFTNYELIVVNDGSTDSSTAICNTYKAKYPQIKLITQENKGLSAARNAGFLEATGTYTWFIDSDDYIIEEALVKLHEQLQKTVVDVMGFSNYHYLESQKKLKPNNINPNTQKHTNLSFLEHKLLFEIAPWIYVFKSAFLKENTINFREDIKIHEDEFYLTEVLGKLTSIQCISDKIYVYRIRENSLMRSHRVLDKLYSFQQLIHHYQILKAQYLYSKYWDNRIYHTLQVYYKLYFSITDKNKKRTLKSNFLKVRSTQQQIHKSDFFGIKLMKFLHNRCFPLYKFKLLKS